MTLLAATFGVASAGVGASGSFCVAGAALGAPQVRFASYARVRRQVMTLGATSFFCVAGAALGAPQVRFAWQAQHLEHLHRGLRKSGDEWWLWAPPPFAWQAQHLEHLRFVLRGRRSTWNTFIEVCGSPATSDDFGRRLVLRRRCSTWSTSGWFCMAGAALEASQLRFAGHFLKAQTIHTTPSTLHHHQTHHHQDNTISTTPSTQSHQHITIYTTSSTQHHLHYIINTTHLHYIIIKHNIINTHHLRGKRVTCAHWKRVTCTLKAGHLRTLKASHLRTLSGHVRTLMLGGLGWGGVGWGAWTSLPLTCSLPGAALGALPAILALLPHSMTYSTVGCPKTLLTCGVIRSYIFLRRTRGHQPSAISCRDPLASKRSSERSSSSTWWHANNRKSKASRTCSRPWNSMTCHPPQPARI